MIKLDNLIVGYYGQKVSPSISGYIKRGSMIAVIGPNGVGKSSFLKTLVGFLPPSSGKLEFKKLNRPIISYLPQIKTLNVHCPLTVFDVVSMGCWPKLSLFAKLNYYQKIMICRALKAVQLLHLLRQYISNLSGGQFQRMLFARILVQQASLILLDEPFQNIDRSMCKRMIYSVYKLCNRGCTAIIVLHDDRLVNQYFSHALVLNDSCSIWKSLS